MFRSNVQPQQKPKQKQAQYWPGANVTPVITITNGPLKKPKPITLTSFDGFAPDDIVNICRQKNLDPNDFGVTSADAIMMKDERAAQYIKSLEDAKKAMRENGWNEKQIKNAIETGKWGSEIVAVPMNKEQKKAAKQSMKFVARPPPVEMTEENIANIVYDPHEFDFLDDIKFVTEDKARQPPVYLTEKLPEKKFDFSTVQGDISKCEALQYRNLTPQQRKFLTYKKKPVALKKPDQTDYYMFDEKGIRAYWDDLAKYKEDHNYGDAAFDKLLPNDYVSWKYRDWDKLDEKERGAIHNEVEFLERTKEPYTWDKETYAVDLRAKHEAEDYHRDKHFKQIEDRR